MIEYNIDNAKKDIENLQDQNSLDYQKHNFQQEEIDALKTELKAVKFKEEYLMTKLEKDYASLRRIIIDENVSCYLNVKIEENRVKAELDLEEAKDELNTKIDTNKAETDEKIDVINENLVVLNYKTSDYINLHEYTSLVEDDDWSKAIQTALNDCYDSGKILLIPNSEYKISSQINLSSNKQTYIEGGGNAIFKVTSSIDNVFYKDANWGVKGGKISGLVLDCNRMAKNGIFLECYNRMEITSNRILNFLENGIKLVDTTKSAEARVYENIIENNYIRGLVETDFPTITEDQLPPYGLFLNSTGTDNNICSNVIVNVGIAGIKTGEGNNIIAFNHFYGYPENFAPQYFIETMGQSNIQNNYFDSGKICIKIDYHDVSVTDNVFFWPTNSDFDRSEFGGILLNNSYGNKRVIITNNRFSYKGDGVIGFDIKCIGKYYDDTFIAFNSIPEDKITNIFKQFIKRVNARYINNDDMRLFFLNDDGIRRWVTERNTDEEGGENTGSHYIISSYEDDGTTRTEQFKINRANGNVSVLKGDFSLIGNGKKIYLRSSNGTTSAISCNDNGQLLYTPLSGTTAERPESVSLPIGTLYFDTDLGYPIFARGGYWVTYTGEIVG